MGASSCKPKQSLSTQPEIATFRVSNGRRFHNDSNSNYPLPNDDEECDRLHLQHFLFQYIWKGNFSAPVDDILKQEGTTVLDVGCGAASWTFEMATDYPNAKFTGIDIAPIQPNEIKPRNVTFLQANVISGLPFEDNSFDYVFQRFLLSGIPKDKWFSTICELTRVLKPGGFLELMELETFSHNIGPNTKKIYRMVCDYAEHKNLDPLVTFKLKSYCEEQGQLENIQTEEKKNYFGAEAGKIGQVLLNDYTLLFKGLKTVILQTIDIITPEEYDEILEKALNECKELNTVGNCMRVYARKKLNS